MFRRPLDGFLGVTRFLEALQGYRSLVQNSNSGRARDDAVIDEICANNQSLGNISSTLHDLHPGMKIQMMFKNT